MNHLWAETKSPRAKKPVKTKWVKGRRPGKKPSLYELDGAILRFEATVRVLTTGGAQHALLSRWQAVRDLLDQLHPVDPERRLARSYRAMEEVRQQFGR